MSQKTLPRIYLLCLDYCRKSKAEFPTPKSEKPEDRFIPECC